jgi:DNA-binding NarL/FixJ family response regulator
VHESGLSAIDTSVREIATMHGAVQSPSRRFRIFVLDPAPLMRAALKRVIEESADFSWTGESADPERAVLEMTKTKTDLALIDIAFPHVSGIELIRTIGAASPKTHIVVFTTMAGTVYGDRCLKAGASGFVSKRQPTPILLKALRRVAEGGVWMDEDLTSQLLARKESDVRDPVDTLSATEFEVFRLIAEGHSNITIAQKLHRSVRTIETYRSRIKVKLELSNATELAQYAVRCLMEWPSGATPKPPRAADQATSPASKPLADAAAPSSENARGRALIVEDNIPTSSALAVTCRRLGYRTDIARTAGEAHAKLQNQPDVMLLDLKLAGGDDGTDVLRTVRKDKLPTRVAVVTGLDDVAALEQVENLAPDALFRKPLRFSDLEQWLSAARLAVSHKA